MTSLILMALLAAASPAAPSTADAGSADEKICRTEKTTESRIPNKRVCRTRAEWDQIARQTQKDLGDAQRTPRGDPGNT